MFNLDTDGLCTLEKTKDLKVLASRGKNEGCSKNFDKSDLKKEDNEKGLQQHKTVYIFYFSSVTRCQRHRGWQPFLRRHSTRAREQRSRLTSIGYAQITLNGFQLGVGRSVVWGRSVKLTYFVVTCELQTVNNPHLLDPLTDFRLMSLCDGPSFIIIRVSYLKRKKTETC